MAVMTVPILLGKRGPTALDLQAILLKCDCDNLQATSNKIMYKTTDSQYLKLKMGDKRDFH